ncbi:histidine kinase [Fulvivirgaceae bacterium BMA10]|uniref:Histidine kinase n=1 Tax=Splendidivirga corallicola TaxID=3051826 RepID=A0ABT8KSA4_9BACT|nr:histidine kinase [Fulvivirgaceae bacterium BMA10]
MIHPILRKSRYLYYYISIWALVSVAHFFIIYYFYDIEPIKVVVESLTFNVLFGALGLSFWYAVKFSNVDSQPFASIVVTHLVAAVIAVGLWIYVGHYILNKVFSTDSDYIFFLNMTRPWRFVSGILYYSLTILFYYLTINYDSLQEKIQHETELKSLVQTAELNTLKSQLNPHFIFNSLNSISALTLIKPEKAQEMVIKLSDFLRYSLGQDGKQKTSLKEELKNIELYLDIERIRFGDRLNFEKEVSKDCENKFLPNLILQPIFENAIKHGVHESIEGVTINMNCICENNNLKIKVKNNFDPDAVVKKGEGIGLRNIEQRLLLSYQRTDLLRVKKSKNFFEVQLTVPQEED